MGYYFYRVYSNNSFFAFFFEESGICHFFSWGLFVPKVQLCEIPNTTTIVRRFGPIFSHVPDKILKIAKKVEESSPQFPDISNRDTCSSIHFLVGQEAKNVNDTNNVDGGVRTTRNLNQ